MTYPYLTSLARIVPRSNNDLIHMTQGSASEIANLALALWHERDGQHAHGCDVCDLPRVEAFAAEVLAQASHETLLAVEADARTCYYTAFYLGTPDEIKRTRDAYQAASQLVAEAVQL